MKNLSLFETFAEFKSAKNIDRPTMASILEDVFRSLLIKKYGEADNFDIIVNADKGDFEIWRNRVVVDDPDFEDENTQIKLSEAIRIDADYEVGEDVSEEYSLADLGRRTILSIRQNLTSKILEIEKDNLYKKYKERVGLVITGEVYQIWKKEFLILDDEDNELILPKSEMIQGDFYRKGESLKAVIDKVVLKNGTPVVYLSRTSPVFLERLFEQEVPEIFDGLITIKNIVRDPGRKAKVAVETYDERIDPVGACVGMRGSRIRGIVHELRNENIDVVNYTDNLQLYVQRALSPAKVKNMKVDEEEKAIEVILDPSEVRLAIGKSGVNIRLAGELTGYKIDVFREIEEDDEDVNLDEFKDEIEEWIIDELKKIGCDTAKSVLEIEVEDLEKRTDLEVQTIEEVVNILKAEFE